MKTSSPFDAVAKNYDLGFGSWPAARLFRFRLIDRVVRSVPPHSSLLDIGSGSGEDAVWLSSMGFKVTGIDPSSGMVEVARAKAQQARSKAEFHEADLSNFATKGGQSFDAVYSDFGAMNCVPVDTWAGLLSQLVRPGGSLFLVLMGRYPFPEFLLRGPQAWRGRGMPNAPVSSDQSIWVNYPDPTAIQEALRPFFAVSLTETLGFLVPPPGTANWPRRHPFAFSALAALEMLVSRRRFLCRFSDHFLICLTRR